MGSRRHLLKSEIARLLRQKYKKHWFQKQPEKDANFRIIRFDGKLDSIFEKACLKLGICTNWIHWQFLNQMTIWINPNVVLFKTDSNDFSIDLVKLDKDYFEKTNSTTDANIKKALLCFFHWRKKRMSKIKKECNY